MGAADGTVVVPMRGWAPARLAAPSPITPHTHSESPSGMPASCPENP